MNKCSLCGKRITTVQGSHFGLNCLKKSCSLLNIQNVKNLKAEKKLNKDVMKICNKNNLPTSIIN